MTHPSTPPNPNELFPQTRPDAPEPEAMPEEQDEEPARAPPTAPGRRPLFRT